MAVEVCPSTFQSSDKTIVMNVLNIKESINYLFSQMIQNKTSV